MEQDIKLYFSLFNGTPPHIPLEMEPVYSNHTAKRVYILLDISASGDLKIT